MTDDDMVTVPGEFDPEIVEVMALAVLEAGSDPSPRAAARWLGDMRLALTAARDAGWEMVETTELAALRTLSSPNPSTKPDYSEERLNEDR